MNALILNIYRTIICEQSTFNLTECQFKVYTDVPRVNVLPYGQPILDGADKITNILFRNFQACVAILDAWHCPGMDLARAKMVKKTRKYVFLGW